jgi:hypothetical protein
MKLKASILILGGVALAAALIAIEWRFEFTPTSMILVLLTLLIAVVIAIKLSLNVRWLRKLALRAFSGDRASLSCEFGSGAVATTIIFVVGAALGFTVYVDRINAFYKDLSRAYCRADVLSDVFATEDPGTWPALADDIRKEPCSAPRPTGSGGLDPGRLYKLLRHFNLLDPDDPSDAVFGEARQKVNSGDAFKSANRNARIAAIVARNDFKFSAGSPTIDLVLALAGGLRGSTQNSNGAASDNIQRGALAAALAQHPHPLTIIDRQDLSKLKVKLGFDLFGREPVGRLMQRLWTPCPTDQKAGATKTPADCRKDDIQRELPDIANGLSRWGSFTFERPSPELTSQEIAILALKLHEEAASTDFSGAQNDAVVRFMSVLLAEMRGTEDVRAERRFVNALIGYERCAVIVFAFVFIIFLLVRFVQRLPHDIHQSEITAAMERFREKWFPGKAVARLAADIREKECRDLLVQLENGCLAGEEVKREAKKKVTTIPLRILGAALDEMGLSHQDGNSRESESNFVETLSDGERRSLDGSRLIFDTLLPTFPAIGFVGTVSSLLIAMSEADRIVRTDEALARGVAASQVTDILSLCFSTTLLALLCVLVFSPLSMMQASRERKLIDETEYQVQTVLRPEQP